jgi:toxin ParE1/3/4
MMILWSPLAIQRVQEISDYIASDSPKAAGKWIETIFEKVNILRSNPEIGRIVPELGKSDLRELLWGNYRIVYRCSKKQIFVLTVRHSKQVMRIE